MITREEAITQLEILREYCESMLTGCEPVWRRDCEALSFALTALRPVSREQVEKVWRGEWITKHYVDGILEGTNFDECSKCGYKRVFDNIELKTAFMFCPHCGAAQTDEAVEMVMKRMEALHEAN